jgi:hypothetical protein
MPLKDRGPRQDEGRPSLTGLYTTRVCSRHRTSGQGADLHPDGDAANGERPRTAPEAGRE